MRSVLKGLAVAAAVVLVGLAGLLSTLAVKRASLHYENGRHFDIVYSVVYDESAITLYALLALGAAALAALLIFVSSRWRKMR